MSDEFTPTGHIEDEYGDPPAAGDRTIARQTKMRPPDVTKFLTEKGTHPALVNMAKAVASGLHKHGFSVTEVEVEGGSNGSVWLECDLGSVMIYGSGVYEDRH